MVTLVTILYTVSIAYLSFIRLRMLNVFLTRENKIESITFGEFMLFNHYSLVFRVKINFMNEPLLWKLPALVTDS